LLNLHGITKDPEQPPLILSKVEELGDSYGVFFALRQFIFYKKETPMEFQNVVFFKHKSMMLCWLIVSKLYNHSFLANTISIVELRRSFLFEAIVKCNKRQTAWQFPFCFNPNSK
jgi:hypothetical protein